jgi:hypothetical protein
MIEYFKNTGIALATIGAVIVSLKKTRQFLKPLKITTSTKVVFDNSGPDEIIAQVINTSGSSLFIASCRAREVKNIKRILIGRFRCELATKQIIGYDIFDVKSYDLLKNGPIKLEPGELIKLNHKLNFSIPFLSGFFNSEYVVQVKLTNGKAYVSSRNKIPIHWLYKYQKEKNNQLLQG